MIGLAAYAMLSTYGEWEIGRSFGEKPRFDFMPDGDSGGIEAPDFLVRHVENHWELEESKIQNKYPFPAAA